MAKLREDRVPATAPNQPWAMDWIYDQLFDGRRIWVLTMVDTCSRVCPALSACRVASAAEVVTALDEAVRRYGAPARLRVDQGCEFTSRELDLWAYARGVVLDFSRPAKPMDNAHAEAFNARFRAECLNQHWFFDLEDARAKLEAWRIDYNEMRPHSTIGDRPPMSLIPAPKPALRGSWKPEILT
jgi:putative transposase